MKKTSSMIFTLVLVLSLVLIMAGPMASPVQAEESGANSGSTADNDGAIGTQDWYDVNNALDQDDSYADVILTESNNTSHYLKITGFSFSISGSATILGIEVGVDRRESQTPETVFDNSICLVKDGVVSGDDRSGDTAWPVSDTDDYETYGGSTDLWGESWSAADINDPDFGAAISAVNDGSADRTARVDHVQITVYYSVPRYSLTMAASPSAGGQAYDDTGGSPYEEGESVQIRAHAEWGYKFAGWTAEPPSDSSFAANVSLTSFTMPAYDVTVTANFEVDTGPEELPTVNTLPASGKTQVVATLNMEYTMGDYSPVYVRFAYKKAADSDWSFTPGHYRFSDSTYATLVAGLTAGTLYDFKAQLRYDHHWIEDTTPLQFETDTSSSLCFIATAAYGTPAAEQIDVLREFRDTVLLKSIPGSQFVSLYYRFSPSIADFISRNELLRTLVRELLIDPIVCVVEATGHIWRR